MENIIDSSKVLLKSLKTDYANLQTAFKAETDIEKMDELDVQISKIGKDIVFLESKVISFEIAAQKTSFNSVQLAPLLKEINEHNQETARVIREHTDAVERAKYLASRVTSGAKLVGDILTKIV
ncbi:MAG: hypothetical protein NTX59_09080 [Elusimicrobia bacterium]|nr:hypothetical protein [Elusimicrobiota bacterium]